MVALAPVAVFAHSGGLADGPNCADELELASETPVVIQRLPIEVDGKPLEIPYFLRDFSDTDLATNSGWKKKYEYDGFDMRLVGVLY